MVQTLFLALVLSGPGVQVVDRGSTGGLLLEAQRALGLPELQWGMALVEFKQRARGVNDTDALTPCRPDGEVCRLLLVREYVDPGAGELPSLRELFAQRDRERWAAAGALRLGPVAELVFDRTTARLAHVRVMQFRELTGADDARLEAGSEFGGGWRTDDAVSSARLVPGSWTLSPREGGAVADAAEADLGTVRFVASPWAEVSCGDRVFGQTPFREQRLPPGQYDCALFNPDLGATQNVHVEVRPNRRSVVRVRFE